MTNSYGIGGIGGYDPSLMSNPYFLAALQSYNPYNPSFQGAQQNTAAQQAVDPTIALQTSETAAATPNPAFKAAPQEESGNGLLVGGALAAITAIGVGAYAAKRGNGEGIIKGFKNIWNNIKGNATPTTEALKKLNLKNAQEYTVSKGGTSIVMKDGKPIRIITSTQKEITEAKKVQEWVRNNSAVIDEIKNNFSTVKLPKGFSLRYTRLSSDGKYKLIVENGKVVEALGQDRTGKFIKVADDQLEAFIRNHAGVVKDAETLKKTLTGKNVRLINKQGKTVSTKSNITLHVRDGKVVEAQLGNGRKLTEEELKMLQNDFGKEINLFGKESGNVYGLTDYEYIYKQKGGQKVRFTIDKTKKVDVKGVNSVTKENLNNADEIQKFLEKNTEIKDGIETISGGTLAEGFRLGNTVLKADSGNVYTIVKENVTEVKLADGTVKKGKDLKEWLKVAENKNEYEKILEELK
ncbi:hypothetical protein IJ750_03825 [bacterium]|nr:hypothetical protein [bacterium]